MDVAKLALSEEELRLVMDPGIILTKNAIIARVYELFGMISAKMQEELVLPAEVAAIPPKISKGESYQALPYVMLDQPRYFSAHHVLAVRTFFWWGHYFSVSLQLKGRYQQQFEIDLADHYDSFARNDYFMAIGDDEWQHHVNAAGYMKLSDMGRERYESVLARHGFVKISKCFPLSEWDRLLYLLPDAQKELCGAIGLLRN